MNHHPAVAGIFEIFSGGLLALAVGFGLAVLPRVGVAAAAAETAPGPAEPPTAHELLRQARAAYAAGEDARAADLFAQLCALQPQDGNHWFELGRAQYRLSRFTAADASFLRARQLGTTAHDLMLWSGFTAFKLEHWKDTDQFLSALPAAQITPETRLKRAIARFNLGDGDAAGELQTLARQDTPVGLTARYYYGLTLENAGDRGAAFDLYRSLEDRHGPYGMDHASFLRVEGLKAEQPNPLILRADFSFGYDSRPSRENDDLDTVGSAPDGFGEFDFMAAVQPLYALKPVTPLVYWLSLMGDQRTYFHVHDLDYTSLELMQALQNSPEGNCNFRVDQFFRRNWLGGGPYFDEWGGDGLFEWRHRDGPAIHRVQLLVDAELADALSPAYQPEEGGRYGVMVRYVFFRKGARDWNLTVPVEVGWRHGSASLASESYGQWSVSVAPSTTLFERVRIGASAAAQSLRYRTDATTGLTRRDWPLTLDGWVETLVWRHGSVAGHFEYTEQGSNQALYRYVDRQVWVSISVWL
ncbi:MAG: tetratricopeptide repeat protein [Planctomycetota bacterium]